MLEDSYRPAAAGLVYVLHEFRCGVWYRCLLSQPCSGASGILDDRGTMVSKRISILKRVYKCMLFVLFCFFGGGGVVHEPPSSHPPFCCWNYHRKTKTVLRFPTTATRTPDFYFQCDQNTCLVSLVSEARSDRVAADVMLAKEYDVKGERHGERGRALITNLGKRSRTFGVGWVRGGGGRGGPT